MIVVRFYTVFRLQVFNIFNGHLENRHDTNVVILYNAENKHI